MWILFGIDEKGSNFLLHLERTVGGLDVWIRESSLSLIRCTSSLSFFCRWLAYMKAYVARFRGMSITTDDWLTHFWLYWNQFPEKAQALKAVDFEAWLHGEGTELPVKMTYDTSLADASYHLASRWNAARNDDTVKFSPDDIKEFTANQVGLFLETLSGYEAFDKATMDKLNEAYSLEKSGNDEIRLRWYKVALKAGCYAQEASVWVRTAGR